MSEFAFYGDAAAAAADPAQRLNVQSVVSSPSAASSSEGPARAIDNNLGTKWFAFGSPDLIFTFSSPTAIWSYTWATANDADPRDPVKWTLEGSTDGSTWIVVDDTHATTAFAAPTARSAWVGTEFMVVTPQACSAGGGACAGTLGYQDLDSDATVLCAAASCVTSTDYADGGSCCPEAPCPAGSSGGGVAAGCLCDAGYSGPGRQTAFDNS